VKSSEKLPEDAAFYGRILSGKKPSVYEKYGFFPVTEIDEPRSYAPVIEMARSARMADGRTTVAEAMAPFGAEQLEMTPILRARYRQLLVEMGTAQPTDARRTCYDAVTELMKRLMCRSWKESWANVCK
jgi:hypothetical protein